MFENSECQQKALQRDSLLALSRGNRSPWAAGGSRQTYLPSAKPEKEGDDLILLCSEPAGTGRIDVCRLGEQETHAHGFDRVLLDAFVQKNSMQPFADGGIQYFYDSKPVSAQERDFGPPKALWTDHLAEYANNLPESGRISAFFTNTAVAISAGSKLMIAALKRSGKLCASVPDRKETVMPKRTFVIGAHAAGKTWFMTKSSVKAARKF